MQALTNQLKIFDNLENNLFHINYFGLIFIHRLHAI